MKNPTIVVICLCLAALTMLPGCGSLVSSYGPVPMTWRVSNDPSGSCSHRSMAMLMGAQGRKDLGRWWYQNHRGPMFVNILNGKLLRNSLHRQLTAAEIPFIFTAGKRNVAFLRWCVENKLACGVMIDGGDHMVNLTYIDRRYACIVDNNRTSVTYWVPTKRFLNDWYAADSYAITPLLRPVSSSPPSP